MATMVLDPSSPVVIVGGGLLAALVAVLLVVFVLVPIFKGIGWVIAHVFKFVRAMLTDAFRLVGGVVAAVVMSPLAVVNLVLGRWSAAQHYGRSIQAEVKGLGATIYRLAIGHPARLFCAQGAVEGLEQRVPAAMANVPPATDVRAGQGPRVWSFNKGGVGALIVAGLGGGKPAFPGYEIVGTLPGGGSGSRLYVARPDAAKLAAFERLGFGAVGDVVIKCFQITPEGDRGGGESGSSLPQIVRESRALEAAKRLGLVLEHELTAERFFYVMRYVPGDALSLATQRLHAASPSGGLEGQPLADGLSLVADLVGTLAEYHAAGLWHKDVKPDNIIVHDGRAHLVDFGLVTPLRSSMTLTTHGTEYFRDPELVRMALRGVKVHQVDGAKFDVYAAGAVLYSVIENSFPAHGGLSQITRTCPEALRWVVRRAMTEYDKRYPTAAAMLADLRVVVQAAREGRAASLRPADLPSVREGGAGVEAVAAGVAGVSAALAGDAVFGQNPPAIRPGVYPPPLPGAPVPPAVGRFGGGEPARVHAAATPRVRSGKTASEQLASARARVEERRRRAGQRLTRSAKAHTGVNWGVGSAAIFVGGIVFVGTMIAAFGGGGGRGTAADADDVAHVEQAIDQARAVLAARTRLVVDALPARVEEAVRTAGAKLDRAARRARAKAATQPVASDAGEGARVLVVQEPAAFDDEVLGALRAEYTRLGEHGFDLIGASVEAGGAGGDGTAEERERMARTDTLTAELRTAVGLNPVPSDGARALVSGWLAKAQDVHAVLWIARESEDAAQGAGGCVRWLVAGPRLTATQGSALERLLRGDN